MFSVCASVEHLLQIGVQEHPRGVQLFSDGTKPLEGWVHFLKVLPGAVVGLRKQPETTGFVSWSWHFSGAANLCLCVCMCDPPSLGTQRAHACRYMHAHTHTHARTHACTHTHVCMYAHAYRLMHKPTCGVCHICTHTNMYACIYTCNVKNPNRREEVLRK